MWLWLFIPDLMNNGKKILLADSALWVNFEYTGNERNLVNRFIVRDVTVLWHKTLGVYTCKTEQ